MLRSLWPSVVVGVLAGEVAVLLHAQQLTGGTQTTWGWALGWQVLLASIAVGLGGLLVLGRFATAGLAALTALVIIGLLVQFGVETPGYQVGARIVGATGTPPHRSRPPSSPPSSGCGDYHFIGVRGSGATAADAGGYGTVVHQFLNTLTVELGSGIDLDRTPLDYAAAGVHVLPDPAFFASIEGGAELLTQRVKRSLRDCPERPLILAGHSQGATVVRMALSSLGRDELAEIAAVALFSDAARDAGATVNRGDVGGRDGSLVWADARLPGYPQSIEPRVQSWCFVSDVVCSFDLGELRFFAAGPPGRFHSLPYRNIAAPAAFEAVRTIESHR